MDMYLSTGKSIGLLSRRGQVHIVLCDKYGNRWAKPRPGLFVIAFCTRRRDDDVFVRASVYLIQEVSTAVQIEDEELVQVKVRRLGHGFAVSDAGSVEEVIEAVGEELVKLLRKAWKGKKSEGRTE